MKARFKAQWQAWSDRFAGLNQRERMLVSAGIVIGGLYLGAMLWIEPMFARAKNYARQSSSQAGELSSLHNQIISLGKLVASDPNTPLRAELGHVEQQLQEASVVLSEFDASLVPPGKTTAMLDGLIRKSSGVHLVGFKTIPAEGLLAAKLKPAQNKPAPEQALTADVYKHGFELKLRGNYLALMAYLKAQEAQPERLLWQRAQLRVLAYPESELTLTIYTLSMDSYWLEL